MAWRLAYCNTHAPRSVNDGQPSAPSRCADRFTPREQARPGASEINAFCYQQAVWRVAFFRAPREHDMVSEVGSFCRLF